MVMGTLERRQALDPGEQSTGQPTTCGSFTSWRRIPVVTIEFLTLPTSGI